MPSSRDRPVITQPSSSLVDNSDRPLSSSSISVTSLPARARIITVSPPSLGSVVVAIILCIGVVSYSASSIFIRFAFLAADLPADADTGGGGGSSSVSVSFVLSALRAVMSMIILSTFFARPLYQKRRTIKRQAVIWAVVGGCFLAVFFTLWITSLQFTSIAVSTVLVTSTPIWTTVIGWARDHQTPNAKVLLGITLSIAGSTLIGLADIILPPASTTATTTTTTGHDGSAAGGTTASASRSYSPHSNAIGCLLAALGSVFTAAYFVSGEETQKLGLTTTDFLVMTYGCSAVILIPLPFAFGATNYPCCFPVLFYVWILVLTIVSSVIGDFCTNFAMQYFDATFISVAALFEPVGATVLAMIVFGEYPTLIVIVGSVVLLIGVGASAFGQTQRMAEQKRRGAGAGSEGENGQPPELLYRLTQIIVRPRLLSGRQQPHLQLEEEEHEHERVRMLPVNVAQSHSFSQMSEVYSRAGGSGSRTEEREDGQFVSSTRSEWSVRSFSEARGPTATVDDTLTTGTPNNVAATISTSNPPSGGVITRSRSRQPSSAVTRSDEEPVDGVVAVRERSKTKRDISGTHHANVVDPDAVILTSVPRSSISTSTSSTSSTSAVKRTESGKRESKRGSQLV